MRTTDRGSLSELRVAARLAELGCRVLVPWGHDCPYDLAAEWRGGFSRVQVKTARPVGNGSAMVVSGAGGTGALSAGDCDAILAWDAAREVVYAVPPGAGRLHLRIEPALNGQGLHVRPASDYVLRAPSQLWPAPLVLDVPIVRMADARASLTLP